MRIFGIYNSIVVTVLYFMFSFVYLSFNFLNWHPVMRFIFIWLIVIANILYAMWFIANKR
jgi:hypothetical protein